MIASGQNLPDRTTSLENMVLLESQILPDWTTARPRRGQEAAYDSANGPFIERKAGKGRGAAPERRGTAHNSGTTAARPTTAPKRRGTAHNSGTAHKSARKTPHQGASYQGG